MLRNLIMNPSISLKYKEFVETGTPRMNDFTTEKEENLLQHDSKLQKLDENKLIRVEERREHRLIVNELRAPSREVTEHITLDNNSSHVDDKLDEGVTTVNELVEGDRARGGFDYENEFVDFSEKVMTYEEKVDQILDWLLTMRGAVNELHVELSLLYKPIQAGMNHVQQEIASRYELESYSCSVYSKCSEKVKELQSMITRLESLLQSSECELENKI